jgi:hypothetical protein
MRGTDGNSWFCAVCDSLSFRHVRPRCLVVWMISKILDSLPLVFESLRSFLHSIIRPIFHWSAVSTHTLAHTHMSQIPTIDPERGAFGVGGQPTGALMRLGRANENGTPLFGVNAIPVFVGPAVGTGAAAAVSASTGVASSPSASASASASDLVRSDNARAPARGNLCVGDVVTVVAYQS